MKQLYQHQLEVAELGFRRNILLADETGAGKTYAGIEVAKRCMEFGGGHVLVIVTKKAVPQWIAAIEEQVTDPNIIRMSQYFDPRLLNGRPTWFVVHYEVVVKIWQLLCKYVWTCVLLDEAHRIKTRSTRKKLANAKQMPRTDAVKNATQLAQRKVAMTGTPWDKDPAELWSLLNWLFPSRYTSYWRFREQYSEITVDWWGYEKVIGCKAPDKLAAEIAPFTFQRTKAELRADLPLLTTEEIHVELEEKQAAAYKKLAKSKDLQVLIEQLDTDEPAVELIIPNALAHIVRMLQLSVDPILLDLDHKSGKLEWLRDWLDDNPHEPVVIFTRFRETAKFIADVYGLDWVVGGSWGSTTPGGRFLNGETRGLVGTIAGMGESLNLQRASTAIFVDQDWSSTTMKQAFDRIHRIDITDPKHIILLKSTDTDQLVIDTFVNKWAQHQMVLEFLRRLR